MANSGDLKSLNEGLRSRMRITKVVVTRSLKTKQGDFFVGLSASIQDDAGGMGSDLISGQSELEVAEGYNQRGFTMSEIRLATLNLGLQVDSLALEQALCGGAITKEEHENALAIVRRNYNIKLKESASKMLDHGDKGEEA